MSTVPKDSQPGLDRFQTTHWSLVVAAGDCTSARAAEALATLCKDYWPPLYAFVRRCGHGVHEAQDLTQGFFARLLDTNLLRVADRERGRFRSFLLASLKHFLANERKAARAQKRGGGRQILSCDFQAAEDAYLSIPVDRLTAERIFEQQWALLLLQKVFERLEAEMILAGKQDQFALLRESVAPKAEQRSYRELAAQAGMTEAAVKMAVHRLRKRYREILRDEIARTVRDPADIDEELRLLFAALAENDG